MVTCIGFILETIFFILLGYRLQYLRQDSKRYLNV